MNVAKVFLRPTGNGELIHIAGAGSRVARRAPELAANVAAFGTALAALGVHAGDRILILCGNRIETIELVLAAFSIGAVAMPASLLSGEQYVATIARATRPACCIHEDPLPACVHAALTALGAPAVRASELRPATAHGPQRPVLLDVPESHPALIVHSSGSTAAPKAIAMSHGAVQRYCEFNDILHSQYRDPAALVSAENTAVNVVPLQHFAGLGACLLGLMTDRRTFSLDYFLPDVYLRTVAEARCPLIFLVPSMYRMLLNERALREADLSALRFCLMGGEPIPAGLSAEVAEAFGAQPITIYGMTECLPGISHDRQALFAGRVPPLSCGRTLLGEARLVGEDGRESAQLGELWLRNPTVHQCYLDPQLNEQRLQDGWLRTGDLFFRDAAGHWFHRGRVDDMFVCNGKNIYPGEVEEVLLRHPAIELACCAAILSRDRSHVPAAVVVARAPVTERELVAFTMQHGPSHLVPRLVLPRQSLPQIGPGKLDRAAARALLQAAYDGQ